MSLRLDRSLFRSRWSGDSDIELTDEPFGSPDGLLRPEQYQAVGARVGSHLELGNDG
ncbi:MAG: hypothetical protein BWY85_01973 [Firmicutes bacterium ADurb.Bin506]|nr:MAG: hypothetical protein BWY85_01973 [Firmicutes bacterium ADurb.Bin506]